MAVTAKSWIKALRSGKYKQGKYQLKKDTLLGDTCYCCLGVLADLQRKATKKSFTYVAQNTAMLTSDGGPLTFAKNIGLTTAACERLADLNDGGGYSFNYIATWLEKKLVGSKLQFKGELA